MLPINAHDLLARLEVAQEALYEHIKRELGADMPDDLFVTQLLILVRIGDRTLSAKEVKEETYTGTSIAYSIKLLVKQGYLERKPSTRDLRMVRLSLTSKALTLVKKAEPIMDAIERRVGSCFVYQQMRDLIRGMELIGEPHMRSRAERRTSP